MENICSEGTEGQAFASDPHRHPAPTARSADIYIFLGSHAAPLLLQFTHTIDEHAFASYSQCRRLEAVQLAREDCVGDWRIAR
jgi:hypothetical protein